MNIIQTLLGLLTSPQVLGQLSALLGESSSTTQKGLGAVIPAILGGLISKGSTETGAGQLIDIMKSNKIDGGILDNLGGLFGGAQGDASAVSGGMGASILKSVLGGNFDAVTKLVGSVSGMSNDSASKLMSLAAPAVLGGVAKAAPSGGFSAASLMSLLSSQKEHLAKFAPPGLGSLLGLGSLGAAASSVAGAASHAASSAAYGAGSAAAAAMPSGGGIRSLWPWAMFAALIGMALLFGMKTCSPRTETPVAETAPPAVTEPATPAVTEPVPATPPAAEPAPAPATPTGEPPAAEIKLPSGATLNVPVGSVGENLFKFLTGTETGSKTFLFDGLTFDTGRATLDAKSQATITAIAGILKEFKTVTASVDGYTDSQGNKGANLRLSDQRAKAVQAALAAAGVEASRITAVGHGDDKPVADNGTPEGRAQNRRTELTATKN